MRLALLGSVAHAANSVASYTPRTDNELMAFEPRDLGDYKLSRLVLFATLDGDLQARDRATGSLLWSTESEPLVQVEQINGDKDGIDAVWITEFTDAGRLLYFNPVTGLEHIPASIKDLVERTPYSGDIVYTGSKHTVLYAIDSESGEVMHAYGSTSPLFPSRKSVGGLLHLGRTEYTLEIHEQASERAWRLKFTRWEPNLRDTDLEEQYSSPLDGVYIVPTSNSTVMAVTENLNQQWTRQVGKVVKVFDVVSDGGSFVVLPQPLLGNGSDDVRSDSLYVDVTANGDFYALGQDYQPLLLSAQVAPWCSGSQSFRTRNELATLLTGVHPTWCRGGAPQVEAPAEPPQLPAPERKYGLMHYLVVVLFIVLLARQDLPEVFNWVLAQIKSRQKQVVDDESADKPSPEKPAKQRKRGKRGGKRARESKGGEVLGPLFVSNEILGYGSHGTTVLKGKFQNREVAIKRMLLNFYEFANREVHILQESDDHKNVVRYYCKHETDQFLYIALELCPGTLEDLLHPQDKEKSLQDLRRDLEPLNALQQIVEGVHYLHSLKIVHRDLKPQNILVASPKTIYTKEGENKKQCLGPVRLLISDFGLCKKLDSDQSSFHNTTAAGAGTSGWTAPEISMGSRYVAKTGIQEYSTDVILEENQSRRLTRAVDIFSLGCVFYYVLSGGAHPFGESYMRQPNIENHVFDLKLDGLSYGKEASDLITAMISFNPLDRPDTNEIMAHPLFWTDRDKLDLLVKVSDRLEHDTREEYSELLQRLEKHAPQVVGADWHTAFPKLFIDNLGKYRKYHGDRIIDLLRALRNKLHHYNDFSDELKECVGALPSGYLQFFTSKFPGLFMVVYHFAKQEFANEDVFIHYFKKL